jgi:cell division protein ZapA
VADLNVEIAGRSYRLACADGQEPHLIALAHEIDAEAQKLLKSLSAQPEEARLLLMVALVMADRARDAEAAASAGDGAIDDTAAAADRIAWLAERIETAARTLAPR